MGTTCRSNHGTHVWPCLCVNMPPLSCLHSWLPFHRRSAYISSFIPHLVSVTRPSVWYMCTHTLLITLPIYWSSTNNFKGLAQVKFNINASLWRGNDILYSPDPPPFLLGVMLRVWERDSPYTGGPREWAIKIRQLVVIKPEIDEPSFIYSKFKSHVQLLSETCPEQ